MTDTISAKDVLSEVVLTVRPTTEGILQGIITLYQNESKRAELAKKGKAIFGQEFTIDLYASKLEAIYDKVLNR